MLCRCEYACDRLAVDWISLCLISLVGCRLVAYIVFVDYTRFSIRVSGMPRVCSDLLAIWFRLVGHKTPPSHSGGYYVRISFQQTFRVVFPQLPLF